MSNENVSGAANADGQNQPTVESLTAQLQAERSARTKAEQAAKSAQEELDALQPYVTMSSDSAGGDEQPQNRQETAELQSLKTSMGQLKTEVFFMQNPDLRDVEDVVFAKFQKTSPKKPVDVRLTEAAKATREWLTARDEKVRAEVADKSSKDKRQQSEAEADGVLVGNSTPPITDDKDQGWRSKEDYEAARRNAFR